MGTSRAAVPESELEERLSELASGVEDPRAGLFGPGSELWAVNRHAALFLGGGRAALLQVAHPEVAQAVVHHSRYRTDPYGRFQRTFAQVFPMVWGSLDRALAAARSVHRVHRSVHGSFDEDVGRYRRGDRYDANHRDALRWVHATLWETSIQIHELLVAPLGSAAKGRYYRETLRFAGLFGLAADELPASWESFLAYNREMWESGLAVGAAGREIARHLFVPPEAALGGASRWLRTFTAGLLPPPLREGFGLPWGDDEQRRFARAVRRLPLLLRALPARLRYVPPYFEARRRLAGRAPDALGRVLLRLYLGAAGA